MTTLTEWERELDERIKYIELIGEIDLPSEWTQRFGSMIAGIVRNDGPMKAVRKLEDKCPICLAVYLVAKGINGYQGGNYWSSLAEETGLNGLHAQNYLRQFFKRFLVDHSWLFRSLDDVRENAAVLQRTCCRSVSTRGFSSRNRSLTDL